TPERVGSPPVLSTSGTSTTTPGPRAAPSLTSWAPAAPSARSAKSPMSKYEPRAKIGMVHPPGSASWLVTRCSARTAGMSSTNTLPRGRRPSPRPPGSGRAQHPRSAEQLVDPGRYRHGRRTLADLVEGRGHRARAEVHLDGPGAGSRCRPDEAGGGVDQAGRPDGREHVGLPERVLDLVQVVRDLAEPHHVGPQRGPTAARAGRPVHEVVVPRHALAAAEAASRQQLAVHVQHLPRTGTLVEVVDVLGHEQDVVVALVLEARQRQVGRVGHDLAELPPPGVVEALDQVGVARERLGRGDVPHVVPLPQAALVAERPEAGLGRDPGAGQHHDAHAPSLTLDRLRSGRQGSASTLTSMSVAASRSATTCGSESPWWYGTATAGAIVR